jgi:hypothetical protein
MDILWPGQPLRRTMERLERRGLVADSPTQPGPSRRDFVARLGAGVSAAWLASIWPQALADAAEAAGATATGQAPKYRVLTAAQADDFGAIADRIIPPDDAPGARAVGSPSRPPTASR